jgi:hypothetical protein
MRAMWFDQRVRERELSRQKNVGACSWLVFAACACGCTASERTDRDMTPAPTGVTAAATSSPSAAPTARASAAPAVATSGIEGKWEGRYDAKKGSVALPPKLRDKALANDDGKTAVGQGAIEITILAGGDVLGKMSGPLGAGTISGKVDGSTLRAGVRADDPSAPNAMSGVFTGERKGETFACELRVAGPDGTVIRESTVELARKR